MPEGVPEVVTEVVTDVVVEVNDLTKSYRATRALRGVSFAVPAGEVFTIVGPNGSGKTTIVEILEGLRRHDGGASQSWADPPATGK